MQNKFQEIKVGDKLEIKYDANFGGQTWKIVSKWDIDRTRKET